MSRKLQFLDAFKAARIIKELGLREEMKEIAQGLDKDSNVYDVGIDMILTVVAKAVEENGEKLIYEFLAGPFEKDPEEISKIELTELVPQIKEIADIDKWKDFLSSASQLVK